MSKAELHFTIEAYLNYYIPVGQYANFSSEGPHKLRHLRMFNFKNLISIVH